MTEGNTVDLKALQINPLLEKLRTHPFAGKSENNYFKSFDGTKIFYRKWNPLKKVEKIIIVAHGMGGHGEFFVLLADRLIEHGILVIAPDYRHHGYSDGEKGDLIKFKYILKDYHFFIEFIKKEHPSVPIFLLGESMGGIVTINFAKDFPNDFSNLSGLILFAPGVKRDFSKKFKIVLTLIAIPLFLLRFLFPSTRIISAKGREEEGIKNLIHQQYDKTDPIHLKKLSIRYVFQLFKYMRRTRKIASQISVPIIIFQGEEDKGISPEAVKEFYEKLSSKDKKLILIKDGFHELFTDPSFQDKWTVLIDWINEH